jgi:hypothetical protein
MIFAISALADLYSGEVTALEWGDVDLDARRILVQRQARHGRVAVSESGHGRGADRKRPVRRIVALAAAARSGSWTCRDLFSRRAWIG